MNIFILTPDDSSLDDVLWEKCNYHGKVTVREQSEALARQYVAKLFNIDPDNKEPNFESPWLDGQLVACELFEGDLYPQEGDPGVLHPSSLRDA